MPMPKIFHKFRMIFLTYDWAVMEFFGATCKIVIGLFILRPEPAFRAISGYASVANELYWGWGLFLVGLIHFLSVFLHRIIPFPPYNRYLLYSRRISTFIGGSFWIWSAAMTMIQSKSANIVGLIFAVMGFWIFMNFVRLFVPEDLRVQDMGRPNGLPDRRRHV